MSSDINYFVEDKYTDNFVKFLYDYALEYRHSYSMFNKVLLKYFDDVNSGKMKPLPDIETEYFKYADILCKNIVKTQHCELQKSIYLYNLLNENISKEVRDYICNELLELDKSITMLNEDFDNLFVLTNIPDDDIKERYEEYKKLSEIYHRELEEYED